ncbi:MAG TPA: hypothetical protein VL976_12580 [Xanthobacteraceae bacterium]|nr:hypothetical protein [Xanthobacteraceae bacterium]
MEFFGGRSGKDRRTAKDRRSGIDKRTEEEKKRIGERRSSVIGGRLPKRGKQRTASAARLASATEIGLAPLQPCGGLPGQPIQGFEFGLKRLNLFDGAIGPFGLDGPVATVPYNEQNRFSHNLRHAIIYEAFGDDSKTIARPELKAMWIMGKPAAAPTIASGFYLLD